MRKNILWNAKLILPATKQALIKLNPLTLYRNILMFIVEMGALATTIIYIISLCSEHQHWFNFGLHISIWLWITVIFSNFSESLAEIKGRAQIESLKQNRSEVYAERIIDSVDSTTERLESIPALMLKKGDVVLVSDGMIIPSDGEILEGIALVDESAITGESAPVVRESGGEKTMVTGGTRILSGQIKIAVTTNAGENFLDQMVNMIESSKRKKTPNEIALEIFLLGLALLFGIVTASIPLFGKILHIDISITVLIALLICLIPTTIGGLLPAISIAGMDRLIARNVIAITSRAIEAAGDINVVLLDKTGTITLGNRLATDFISAPGVKDKELARFAMLSSLADDTPEGRSIVILAKEKLQIRGRDIRSPVGAQFIEFRAETRISGININEAQIRKGAADAIENFLNTHKAKFPEEVKKIVEKIAKEGGTPLVVADQNTAYGVIYLKDVLKEGVSERMIQLKKIGITSVMITGDNPLTTATIAVEAGVSDFIAQATPLIKLERIKKYQKDGYMVAMIGDGTNDAPALAQADLAVAMNVGTQEAREAANMIDLDSNPTKLLDIIEIGKQILLTRGALTAFSVFNDAAKFIVIAPALFIDKFSILNTLNIMHLQNPSSAILSTIIFNAITIPLLTPLVLGGVKYKQASAAALLRKNILIYGVGGFILPFISIKIIDILINNLGWVG